MAISLPGIVAFHEMGHALVASALKGTDPVHKVSIISRGIDALGYTMQRPSDDRFLISSVTSINIAIGFMVMVTTGILGIPDPFLWGTLAAVLSDPHGAHAR